MDITVLLGAPGAGKGTVAVRIAEPLGARHVSTGAMLRDAVKAGSPAGRTAKGYMDRGELVPDAVLADMIGELLAAAPRDARFILDGFPRNIPQAEVLDALAARHGARVSRVVCIDVPLEVALDRLGGRRVCPVCGANFHVRTLAPRRVGICDSCGAELVTRADDQPETIRNRLTVYDRQTAPLIAWYQAAGKLLRIDGSGDADTVAAAVRRLIEPAA
jgi:adenylate kinase